MASPCPAPHLPLSSVPVRGRLSLFMDSWRSVSGDLYVLQLLQQGLQLSFLSQPPVRCSLRFQRPAARVNICKPRFSPCWRGEPLREWQTRPFQGFTVCCLCSLREWEASLGDRSAVIQLSPSEGEVSCGDACKCWALQSKGRLGSLCRSGGCLLSCLIHPLPRKFPCVLYQDKVFQFRVLPSGPLVSLRFFIRVVDAMSVPWACRSTTM